MNLDIIRLPDAADVLAPDGSEVRLLAVTNRGSMAHFRLAPGQVSRAVSHRTVEELWYVLSGSGQMWRRLATEEWVIDLLPGVSFSIPTGMAFQFRNDGEVPLDVLGVTTPPWPGENEAILVDGPWASALD